MSHDTLIIPQTEGICQVESHTLTNVNLSETLALADDVLRRHNEAWAEFLVTGDHRAYWDALALERDREALLRHVNNKIEDRP